MPTLAIDAMGGDFGPSVTVPAAISLLQQFPDLKLFLVGREKEVKSLVSHSVAQKYGSRLTVLHSEEVVTMTDSPLVAARRKKQSSLRRVADLVKAKEADALVSAGNTGALVAICCMVLKKLPHVARPAMVRAVPTLTGHSYLLDLGASVDCQVQHLLQFAIMGSVLSCSLDGVKQPKVALLNIGSEETKGNEQVKQAHQEFNTSSQFNYTGFIEGDTLYEGKADVVVCDGFVGNVALKSSEGVAKMIISIAKEEFQKGLLSKLAVIMTKPLWRNLANRLNPDRYNGAILIGLQGVVVKSHGSTSCVGFETAMKWAIESVQNNITELVSEQMARLSEQVR